MQESYIKKVTEETMNRLESKRGGKREVLLIFMGGDREVDESLKQVKCLNELGVKFSAYMTGAADHIIGRSKVLAGGVDRIIDEKEIWDRAILDRYEAIVVPVFTLNGASKIANMVADNPASNLILLALRHEKKIIIARDSVICCGGPEPSATSFFMRNVNEMINTIKNLGATVTVVKNLARRTAEVLNISTRPVVGNTTVGNATPPAGAPCGGDVSACTECGLCVVNRTEDVKNIVNAGASRVSAKNVSQDIGNDLAKYIDHTDLHADTTTEEIGKLCEEAKKYHFATVCVNPVNVKTSAQLLKGSDVGVTTVIGFPLGATTPTVKALEARDAIANGADEIDMVINVGALKGGNYRLVEDDIKAVREATRGKILKVILETALLDNEQKVKGCQISKAAGADFVKTSTGFGPGGATEEDINLMRETVGPSMGVKASGGIHSEEEAEGMVKAGASRIGASASVAIVTGGVSDSDY